MARQGQQVARLPAAGPHEREVLADEGSIYPARQGSKIGQALGVRLQCRVVAPGSLPRAEMKSKRVVRL